MEYNTTLPPESQGRPQNRHFEQASGHFGTVARVACSCVIVPGVRPPGNKSTGLLQRKRLNPLDSILPHVNASKGLQPHS
ncbi:MAG TPA: hypothetical protein VH186_35505 [Chloroflexia bacterium]|nr:hypothetical protein [Chloroflexia bacterium]